MSSRTSPLAKKSSGTSWRRPCSVPRAISKQSRCRPGRALLSPGSHNQQQRSWLSSSPACNPSRHAPLTHVPYMRLTRCTYG